MAETTYTAIRTGIVDYIVTNLAWATVDNTFDYSPVDAATVFGSLPAVIVDFDDVPIDWAQAMLQGYERGVPILIEVYVELIKEDDSGGRDASEDVATKLRQLEQLFEEEPSIGGLVKGSTIRASQIEKLALQAVTLGVLVRWACLALTVSALT